MTLTRIVKDYDVRRLEFLEATKIFFFTEGYTKMSVSKLTEEVGVAKGTFYHYFQSKEDLLSQWVIHEMQPIIDLHHSVAADKTLTALEKLNKIMQQGRDWDLDHLDIVIGLLTTVYDKNNIRLLVEMNEQFAHLAQEIFEVIIKQGVSEGVFNTPFPNSLASRIIKVSQLFSQDLGALIIKHLEEGTANVDEGLHLTEIWEDIMDRILGAPKNSLVFVDKDFIFKIFDHIDKKQLVKKTA